MSVTWERTRPGGRVLLDRQTQGRSLVDSRRWKMSYVFRCGVVSSSLKGSFVVQGFRVAEFSVGLRMRRIVAEPRTRGKGGCKLGKWSSIKLRNATLKPVDPCQVLSSRGRTSILCFFSIMVLTAVSFPRASGLVIVVLDQLHFDGHTRPLQFFCDSRQCDS